MLAELQRAFARELFAGGERLRVHRETTLAALSGALESVHPVCARLVGAEFFRALALRFAREVPSTSPDLCDY
ncbi:MAG TPA: DNA-binding domain-containing protein, partial [Myxococcota bacterium]|nr:DNA-binding domain-containing protein [Myxococcota bacterium]